MAIAPLSNRPSVVRQNDGPRRAAMLAALLVGQFMALLDVFVVNVALPAIGAGLHASGASLQLVIGGYVVAYATLLITGARLGALYGRRRMYLIGVVVFTTSSLMCGFAPTTAALITFRFVQGAGAAVMVPQIISVIQMNFIGRSRAAALSAYGAVLSAGTVTGLIVGGLVVNADLFGATWRPVFLINVPLGIAVTVLVRRVMPADEPRPGRRLDLRGLAIAIPAVCLVVLPLVLGHQVGWPVCTFVCIGAGVVLAAVFVITERGIGARGGDPLVDLAVLRSYGLSPGLAALSCMQIALGGFLFAFTLHLQIGLGDSALRAGLTYLPMGAAFGLAGFFWRKLPDHVHPSLVPVGLGLCALSYWRLAAGLSAAPNMSVAQEIWLGVLGVGFGFSASPLLTQALLHVAMPLAADASGLLTTTIQLGQVMGVAAFGTVYLSLHPIDAHASTRAMSTTADWLALVSLLAVLPATLLGRTARRPGEPGAERSGA
jgi:EmrB/QacA subfamily drug resistance transporter